MTAAQLRAALERLGLSQVALAKALDLDPRTVRRYVLGERPIPMLVQLAVKYLLIR